MSHLTERIAEFETKYLGKLRRWSALVVPEDLDDVMPFVDEMDAVAKGITQDLADHPNLFKNSWQPILKNAQALIPAVLSHIERIRTESSTNLGLLSRGQRGLAGYRSATARREYRRLDSDG